MQCIEAQNRETGKMKLKMHSKTSPNSHWREGGGEEEWRRERKKEHMREKKRAPWFLKR